MRNSMATCAGGRFITTSDPFTTLSFTVAQRQTATLGRSWRYARGIADLRRIPALYPGCTSS
ncbi:hypothetical protein BQ8482_290051 [Mesorhizobium delmotii]|uniref:Uncharacterized protein n=1 Tax=Mesorhizobium delmotii TaxID=1631247 RepID=A0A2P9AMW3_9HYPH|nr:hypothetical protein BQ8482_290051 [Mesorhizobium delmotii]